jgi:hypothetical protein
MLKSLGYVPSGPRFMKFTESMVHQIFLFEDGLELYGFPIGNTDEVVYTTGIINPTSNQLEQLIEIFTTNHN